MTDHRRRRVHLYSHLLGPSKGGAITARATIPLFASLLLCCEANEVQTNLDFHLGQVAGTVQYLHDEGDLRFASGAEAQLALREGEDNTYCEAQGVVCESEIEADDTGWFEFNDVLPGYYKVSVPSQYYDATDECRARLVEVSNWVDLDDDQELETNFTSGTVTRQMEQNLHTGGAQPGLEVTYKTTLCEGDGCDWIDFTESTPAEQCITWGGSGATEDTELTNTLEFRLTVSDFYILDSDCPGGCCDGEDFMDHGNISDYADFYLDGDRIEPRSVTGNSGSMAVLWITLEYETAGTPMDPFVERHVLMVDWNRPFNGVDTCE